MSIEKNLLQNRCFSLPVVYIQDEVDPKMTAKLKDIIKRHQVGQDLPLSLLVAGLEIATSALARGYQIYTGYSFFQFDSLGGKIVQK